jgi:hypothetical protein
MGSILLSAIIGQPRSFSNDARALIQRLNPPITILGNYPSQLKQGMVVTMNHYSRPGFGAWWNALAVTAICPWNMHWITTSAWVYDDPIRSLVITPPSRWLLDRLTQIYGFTSMPPMPPRAQDIEHRAQAVRNVLKDVDRTPSPVLGFAPEGADSEAGHLSPPPSGVGRLLANLLKRGLKILPVGVYESDHGLVLTIGSVLNPEIPQSRQDQDHQLSHVAMQAIAELLPASLRGSYN